MLGGIMIVFYAIFIGCNGRYGQMAISRLLLERCLKKESNVISKIKDKTAPKGARLHEFFVNDGKNLAGMFGRIYNYSQQGKGSIPRCSRF